MIVLLAIPANWLYATYSSANSRARWQQENYFETDEFFSNLNRISYSLYADLLRQGHETVEEANAELIQQDGMIDEWTYMDRFFDQRNIQFEDLTNEQLEEMTTQLITERLNSNLQWFENIRRQEYLNLEFAAFHHEFGNSILRGDESLRQLAKSGGNLDDFWQYREVMVLSFDTFGNLTVNGTNSVIDARIQANQLGEFNDDFSSRRPIKNTTIVFAVPDWFVHDDVMSQFQEKKHRVEFINIMQGNILMMVSVVGIVAVFMPLKKVANENWLKNIEKLPFEMMGLGFVGILAIAFGMMPYVAYASSGNRIWNQAGIIQLFMYLINIGIWIILFASLIGIVHYLKSLKHLPKKGLNLKFDLKNPIEKKLIVFVGIQCILTIFMILAGSFGMMLAIIFSGCLFLYLRHEFVKIHEDYLRILEIAKNTAHKNKVSIDEDLGVFNSMKEALKQLGKLENKPSILNEETLMPLTIELELSMAELLNSIEILKNTNLEEENQSQIQELNKQLNHLNIRMTELIKMSQRTFGHEEFEVQTLDLVNLIQESITEVEEQMEETTVMLRTQFPEAPVLIEVNPELMGQMVVNLLTNMVKHSLPNTRAYVDVIETEESVKVAFRNISLHEVAMSSDEFIKQKETSITGLMMMSYEIELIGGKLDLDLDGDLVKVNLSLPKIKGVN